VHWLLLSAAAWRALWQLMYDPFRWEKTAHGLARTSRLAAHAGATQPIVLRNTSAARPPRLRAAA
jgi:glycosyltransferase XagB